MLDYSQTVGLLIYTDAGEVLLVFTPLEYKYVSVCYGGLYVFIYVLRCIDIYYF